MWKTRRLVGLKYFGSEEVKLIKSSHKFLKDAVGVNGTLPPCP
jgi:hypothetical protein